jgi:hypothetical protein
VDEPEFISGCTNGISQHQISITGHFTVDYMGQHPNR